MDIACTNRSLLIFAQSMFDWCANSFFGDVWLVVELDGRLAIVLLAVHILGFGTGKAHIDDASLLIVACSFKIAFHVLTHYACSFCIP